VNQSAGDGYRSEKAPRDSSGALRFTLLRVSKETSLAAAFSLLFSLSLSSQHRRRKSCALADDPLTHIESHRWYVPGASAHANANAFLTIQLSSGSDWPPLSASFPTFRTENAQLICILLASLCVYQFLSSGLIKIPLRAQIFPYWGTHGTKVSDFDQVTNSNRVVDN
jgi:hypothetical protein